MFAVVRTGGKQYKVSSGDVIRVERLAAETGNTVQLDDVLLVNDENGTDIGTPVVAGATVNAEVLGEDRGPKLLIFKKKRRQNYRRKRGHRQDYTVLKITGISRV
jgi:large subunit ribosomal protein L21